MRDEFWDAVKGVSIIAVILIHTTTVDSIQGIIWRQFINFPVFVFFGLAGYFCHYDGKYGAFIRDKTRRIMPPLLIFGTVYGLLNVCLLFHRRIEFSMQDVMARFLSFFYGWGYFVPALLQCYLCLPLILKIKETRIRLLAAMLLYGASALLFYSMVIRNPNVKGVAVPIPGIFVTTWLFAFILGVSFQNRLLHDLCMKLGKRGYLMGMLFISFILSIVEGVVMNQHGYRLIGNSQIKVTSYLFSAILFVWLMYRKHQQTERTKFNSLLVTLGQMSLFVYLSHGIFIICYRAWIPRILDAQEYAPIILAGAVIVSEIVLCRLLMRNRAGWMSYFGA